MQRIQIHDMVAIREDITTQRFRSDQPILLCQGQVGTVVELLGNGEAFEVEFADREGQAYALLAIVPEKLMLLRYEALTIDEDQDLSLAQRLAFLKLPLAERGQILENQAEAMIDHYQQDSEWKELMAGDIID